MISMINIFFLVVPIAKAGMFDSQQPSYCKKATLEVKPNHMFGSDCSSLNEDRCLCELTEECTWSHTKHACTANECNKFDHNPNFCKHKFGCKYNCATRRCSRETDDTKNMEPNTKCESLCHDTCECVSRGCVAGLDSSCRNQSDISCGDIFNENGVCRRANALYPTKTGFCNNNQAFSFCAMEKVIAAVNFGDVRRLFQSGINFKPEFEQDRPDPHGIYSVDFKEEETGFGRLKSSNAYLYDYVVVGNTKKHEVDRCLEYNFKLKEEGLYELTIYVVAVAHTYFNVKIGGHIVFPEVSTRLLTNALDQPTRLVVLFEFKGKTIQILDGNAIAHDPNNPVTLSFCYSPCSTEKGSFSVAGYSVVKFSRADVPDPEYCSKLNEDYWGCKEANCYYDSVKNLCLNKPRMSVVPKPAPKSPGTARPGMPKLELVYVVDTSDSSDSKGGCKSCDEFVEISRGNLFLQAMFPGAKFGIAFVNDVNCQPDQKDCFTSPCYRMRQQLTSDIDIFNLRAQKDKIPILDGKGNTNSIVYTTLLAAFDSLFRWSPKTDKPEEEVMRVVVLITDTPFRSPNPAKPPVEDILQTEYNGADACHKAHVLPTNLIINTFQKNGFSLYIAAADNVTDGYINGVPQTAKHTVVRPFHMYPKEFVKQVSKFVTGISTTYAEKKKNFPDVVVKFLIDGRNERSIEILKTFNDDILNDIALLQYNSFKLGIMTFTGDTMNCMKVLSEPKDFAVFKAAAEAVQLFGDNSGEPMAKFEPVDSNAKQPANTLSLLVVIPWDDLILEHMKGSQPDGERTCDKYYPTLNDFKAFVNKNANGLLVVAPDNPVKYSYEDTLDTLDITSDVVLAGPLEKMLPRMTSLIKKIRDSSSSSNSV